MLNFIKGPNSLEIRENLIICENMTINIQNISYSSAYEPKYSLTAKLTMLFSFLATTFFVQLASLYSAFGMLSFISILIFIIALFSKPHKYYLEIGTNSSKNIIFECRSLETLQAFIAIMEERMNNSNTDKGSTVINLDSCTINGGNIGNVDYSGSIGNIINGGTVNNTVSNINNQTTVNIDWQRISNELQELIASGKLDYHEQLAVNDLNRIVKTRNKETLMKYLGKFGSIISNIAARSLENAGTTALMALIKQVPHMFV